MKIRGIFFLILIMNNFCWGQSPFNFGGSVRMDLLDGKYKQGYDEYLFDHVVKQLKGKISTCTIEEIFPDTKLKLGNMPETEAILYNVVYTFDKGKNVV